MTQSLEEFHKELTRDILVASDLAGGFREESFFEIYAEHLAAAGELEAHERTYHADRGIRIDGHGGHPREADGVLSLIIQDLDQGSEPSTLTGTELDTLLKRLSQFARRSLDPAFRNALEESSPGFEAATHINGSWDQARRIKLVVLSNRRLSSRVDARRIDDIEGKEVITTVWDLERLARFVSSGREREDMEVDLVGEHGGAIPALPAGLHTSAYSSFLCVVPGAQLAGIYDRWGSRLLEQNVRSFLQLKGNVNKGMARTIQDTPEMFFAYNNGITATAETVELDKAGRAIERIRNLQIVNGGQTTASLHLQNIKKVDLSSVYVQMKLSIVEPERAEDVVPKISEYANTQNKVNAADFFANHPFHLELEKLSRRILAPAPAGSYVESRWFYERSRGQYLNERARKNGTMLKKFELDFPKTQVITKTDLAKVINLWPGPVGIEPCSVCRGAQKTFSDFATAVSKTWTAEKALDVNDAYFKEVVAKAIIFRETESIVTHRPWYQSGYRAQIVAHSIAKLAFDIQERGDQLGFSHVWAAQGLPESLRDAIIVSADMVREIITNPVVQGQNVSEWAKTQACWTRVRELQVPWPPSLGTMLTSFAEAQDERRSARKEKRQISGIEAQKAVVSKGAAHWRSMLEWGRSEGHLTHKEDGQLQVAARPGALASEAQSVQIVAIERKLVELGFPKP